MSSLARGLALSMVALLACSSGTPPAAAACGPRDGQCPAGCTFRSDADCAICDPTIGVVVPMPVCSVQDPCTNLLPLYQGITRITSASETPVCRTSASASGRTAYDDGAPRTWVDLDGTVRAWCEYRPPGTSATAKRPLLVYVHGSGGNAATVYDTTSIRTKAASFVLGDAARPGFVLVSTQGRNLHWPTSDPEEGTKHDSYHHDTRAASANRDVAFLDRIVDGLVSEGVVDPSRVYVMGWSNGARFAAFYGMARHETPTAGGQRVAAAAVYSGGDPFEDVARGQSPSCKLATYPTSTLPYFLASRACDLVACDTAQEQKLLGDGVAVTPGNVAEPWIATVARLGSPAVQWARLSGLGQTASACTAAASCTGNIATLNHLRWPDGVADGSGVDHEPDMLGFLHDHPLAP